MSTQSDPVVIIGAGQGGLQLAESLRKEKFEGDILLLGDEAHPPYSRPPLSKGLLLGEMEPEQLGLRNLQALEKKGITLKTDTRVDSIDRAAHKLVLQDGSELAYGKLGLATGSRARMLPIEGVELAGVHSLRTLDDVLKIQRDIESAQHVTIIGGGFIGLEMAAVARKLGKDVVLLETAERLMARVVSPQISAYFLELHRQHGVDIRLNSMATAIDGSDGKVSAVSLKDDDRLATDLVVLGVGIVPNAALAEAAGLECDHGIVVDNCGRTSDPDIVACGDCTAMRVDGGLRRLESVQNAVEQAKAAAAALMGEDKPFTAAPWFWSDQYGIKLQMVGLTAGFDEVVERGSREDVHFSFFYFRAGKLIAIDSFNAPQDHMIGRKLLDADNTLTPRQAADSEFDLKSALG